MPLPKVPYQQQVCRPNNGFLSNKLSGGNKNYKPGNAFLNKYKAPPPPQTRTVDHCGAKAEAQENKRSGKKCGEHDNPYTCCFVIPPGLEQCPALNMDDICDNCCAPQKPICSQDPNCHMFPECRPGFALGDTCKYLQGRGPRIPSWLAHCGRVLSFYGYFQEPIPESNIENYRIRQVQIRFYMDDGTIDVFEPKTFDPGFTQGKLIRRHRIPLPPPADEAFYTMEHLNVGCEVEFYGKTFLICGCNDPTRRYLNKLGISVPPNLMMPQDPYTDWRKDRITSLFSRKARIDLTQGKFKQFLQHNGHVLRFWAFWDDRCNEHGHLRQFIIHYFLEDDTVEIKEIPFNTTTSVVPTFLNRGKLLKDHKSLVPPPGIKEEALLILNTTGGCQNVFMDQTFLEDRLCPGIEEKAYVKDRDLAIGAVLNVYGRAFILTDCDEFTKQYYREKYNIREKIMLQKYCWYGWHCVAEGNENYVFVNYHAEDFTPLTLGREEEPKPLPRMEPPPHIGIGDEEDTLKNWDKTEIYPPHKNELKLLVMDKDILGFHARFYKPQHRVNCDRRFIVNYYMADDTVKIYERGHPNTGMKPGTFMKRSRPRKSPTGLPTRYEHGEETEYYEPKDFFVGSTLFLNGFQFLLTSADPPTHDYMEKNKHLFPMSNVCLIIEKAREAFGPIQANELIHIFSKNDTKLNGVMGAKEFRDVICSLMKGSLSEHEIVTLARAFQIKADVPGADMSTLRSVIQTELCRRGFDRYSLQRIEYTLRYHDPCRHGLVDRQTLRTSLAAARLPIDRALLDFLVDNFEAADDCNRVNYCKVIEFLDWEKHPAPKASPSSLVCIMKWLEPKPPNKINCVNYREFLDAVCPNYKCYLPEVCCPDQEQQPQDLCCQQQEEEECDPCRYAPKAELCITSPVCPLEDECRKYEYERCNAGQVITDTNPWNEKDRCDTEDYCEFQMAYDPNSCKEFVRPVPAYMDSRVADAYTCPPQNDCIAPEAENTEILRCGDHIGFETLYDRPTVNRADKLCIWEAPPCNNPCGVNKNK